MGGFNTLGEFLKVQEILKTKIEKAFINFKKLGQEKMTHGNSLVRSQKVKELWGQIVANADRCLQDNLADSNHEFFKSEGLFEQYEELYLTIIGQFKEHELQLEKIESSGDSRESLERSQSIISTEMNLAKLAPITLPKFSGDPQEWGRFADIFKSTVVESTAYSEAVKFHYLQAHLTGEALLLIAGIPLDGKNFNTAWKTLRTAYENERRLVDNCMRNLFAINPVSKELASELRSLLTTTTNIVLTLNSLKRPTEHWDDFLVYLTVNKTDKETRRQWKMISLHLRLRI